MSTVMHAASCTFTQELCGGWCRNRKFPLPFGGNPIPPIHCLGLQSYISTFTDSPIIYIINPSTFQLTSPIVFSLPSLPSLGSRFYSSIDLKEKGSQ
ncbi:hypothetical protein CANTEDRAFT_113768 [Yamadazyma tenuis ATCC 10573]|uniref:Uncharacterized protein n=1 Tax=Candida tenuis (strain ATCC 10573 / BCRC 21748 / CBS 615 / JCM 9827 / NBRC 10315 / NRRL Y-1498 / VKM Y-70) TaxID=590646 RepID=G3B3T8_CANTC|nr:uncharacterized protein CANTEDRAFT_113768 [Yamadazyma tenuis ATCC 10573]EGV63731.1 hypothetical protein CANTEDRAFT_113768 [Yamadazyma tenuis ATCC 10573]